MLSLILATVAMMAVVAIPAGADSTSGVFADDDGSVHESDIEALAYEGTTVGCGFGVYCPDAPVTRGQLAAFIVRSFGVPTTRSVTFSDDDSSRFEAVLERLASAGHLNGCNPPRNTDVCPDRPVTRGQLAAILGSAMGLVPHDGDRFTDDDGSMFEEWINTFADAGVTLGCNPPDNTRYCPDGVVTRAQMASFLVRALDVPAPSRGTASDRLHPVTLRVDDVLLRLPSTGVEMIGLHQSSHEGAQDINIVRNTVDIRTLPSRGRGTTLEGAADIVTHPGVEIRAVATGTIKRASSYTLYCRYSDSFLVIEPDGKPGIEVKMLHVTNLHVRAGDRVEAGVTVVADGPTQFPFASQVDDYSRSTDWPHVHVEVVDTSIPNVGGGGSC